MSESFTAAYADLEWRTNTGTVKTDVESLRRSFHDSTSAMSNDTLRLAVAQEKLDKALARHGPTSTQAKQAEIALRREIESTTSEVRQQDAALERHERQLKQSARGMVAGTGIMQGFGRSIAFASGAFLGGAGLVYALRTAIEASQEAAIVQDQVRVAVGKTGESWAQHREEIDKVIQAQSRLSAFDDEDLYRSFTTLLRRTQDVNEALRLNAIVADVARGRHVDLQAAATLVTRASLGQVGSLRRLGLDVRAVTDAQDRLKESGEKTTFQQREQAKAADQLATRQKVLAELQRAFGGSAEVYGNSEAGAQDKFNKALQDSEEIIGQGVLPRLTDLLNAGTKHLDQLNESGQLQREVNHYVQQGAQVVKGLADGLHLVKEAGEPVVDMLGGLDKAVELALIVGIVGKARRAAASFGLLASSSSVTSTKMVADAAKVEAAWDAATRPRTLTVVERIGQYGTPIAGGAGGAAAAGKTGRFPKIPYVLGFNAPTIVGAAVLTAGGDSYNTGAYTAKRYPNVARLLAKLDAGGKLTDNERSAVAEFGGRSITSLKPEELARLNANLVGQATGLGGDRDRPNQGRAVDTSTTPRTGTGGGGVGGGGKTGDGLSPLQRLLLAEQDPGNDLADSKALLAYYTNIVKHGKLTGQKLFEAEQDMYQQEAKVQSIIDSRAANEKAAAEKRRSTVEKANADRKRQEDIIGRALTTGPYATTGSGFAGGRIAGENAYGSATSKAAKDAKAGLQLGAVEQAFLSEMRSIFASFAPNFGSYGGLSNTQAYELVESNRAAAAHLGDMAGRRGRDEIYDQVSAGF